MGSSSRPQTLTLNKEFKRAYYRGRSKASPFFVCYVIKNRGCGIRYGITTSKKLGNAVARNRARRVIRAAFFSILAWTEPDRDYVFVARERVLAAKSYQVAAAMKGCLKALKEAQGQKMASKAPSSLPQK